MGGRLLCASRGRVGVINADGTGERYLELGVPGQVSWHYGPFFSDGRRVILMSVEDERTWEHNVRSHLWIYDLVTGDAREIAQTGRPAAYMPVAALLPGEERLIVNPDMDGEQIVMSMNLDGSDQVAITRRGEGYTYGISLSPDATRLAFHSNYRIAVVNLDGSNRTHVAGQAGHLYFGPTWSPDGEWLLYLGCTPDSDPGHEYADLCIGRPDGSEHRVVTTGMRHWFATSYGSPETRGSGSNMPRWSPAAAIATYTRMSPGARTAWQFRPDRPDTDHFNRDYAPDEARGGTQICLIDPLTGHLEPITSPGEHTWDFRTVWSPDGEQIAFCRAEIGQPSGLWVMNADGSGQRLLTHGYDGMGADHPAWLQG